MLARTASWMLLLAVLAGCADDGGKADTLGEAARDVDVQATATTGIIRGVVVDTKIAPVANVTVTLTSLNRSASTNADGAFGFEDLEPGTYFMQTSHPDYASVQQSADVVAGDTDPAPIRIQVTPLVRATPLVVAYQATIFVDSSVTVLGGGYTLGGVTTDNSYFFNVDIEPNATVAQTEITWDPVTPLAEVAKIGGGTYHGGDAVATEGKDSPSPAVFRANATEGDVSADTVSYAIFAGGSAGTPAGMVANQRYDCVIHVFYNFLPDPDWVFSEDGDYPTPP